MSLYKNQLEKISAKTASYQVKNADLGTIFTTRGATAAVTFTLPPTADLPAGFWLRFFSVSAYGMVISSSGSSDNIVVTNDAGADSITSTTTSRMIGANVAVVWDGTSWLATLGDGPTYVAA